MMFPIRINVLSDSKKKHLKRLTLFTYLKSACAIIFSLLAIIATLLLISQYYFISYRAALSYNSFVGHPSFRSDSKEIGEVNQKLKRVATVQKDFTLWTPVLDQILTAIPHGVSIESVVFNRENNTFSLVGVAINRQILKECEEALKTLTIIDSVVIPEGELTLKENIPFTVQANLQ